MICDLCYKSGRSNQLIIKCTSCSLGFHRTCLGVSYKKFRFKVINAGSCANSAMTLVLQGFMNSRNAPNIGSLAIQNYDCDYLGKISARPLPPQPRIILENIRQSRELETTWKEFVTTRLNNMKFNLRPEGETLQILSFDADHHRMTNVRKIKLVTGLKWIQGETVNLAAIHFNFPSLSHLEISRRICGISARDLVRDGFPNLTVTLLDKKPSKGPRWEGYE